MSHDSRYRLLSAVDNEISLLALVVLVVEGVVIVLAFQVDSSAATGIIWGLQILLGLVIAAATLSVVMKRYRQPKIPAAKEESPAYDVFISTPMAAYADSQSFESNNASVLRVIDALKSSMPSMRVAYVGDSIRTVEDAEPADISLDIDLEWIKQSRAFILIYPEKLSSSVLVEAGFALGIGRPSFYFVKDQRDLPFILRLAPQAKSVDVRIYTFRDYDHLCQQIGHLVKEIVPT